MNYADVVKGISPPIKSAPTPSKNSQAPKKQTNQTRPRPVVKEKPNQPSDKKKGQEKETQKKTDNKRPPEVKEKKEEDEEVVPVTKFPPLPQKVVPSKFIVKYELRIPERQRRDATDPTKEEKEDTPATQEEKGPGRYQAINQIVKNHRLISDIAFNWEIGAGKTKPQLQIDGGFNLYVRRTFDRKNRNRNPVGSPLIKIFGKSTSLLESYCWLSTLCLLLRGKDTVNIKLGEGLKIRRLGRDGAILNFLNKEDEALLKQDEEKSKDIPVKEEKEDNDDNNNDDDNDNENPKQKQGPPERGYYFHFEDVIMAFLAEAKDLLYFEKSVSRKFNDRLNQLNRGQSFIKEDPNKLQTIYKQIEKHFSVDRLNSLINKLESVLHSSGAHYIDIRRRREEDEMRFRQIEEENRNMTDFVLSFLPKDVFEKPRPRRYRRNEERYDGQYDQDADDNEQEPDYQNEQQFEDTGDVVQDNEYDQGQFDDPGDLRYDQSRPYEQPDDAELVYEERNEEEIEESQLQKNVKENVSPNEESYFREDEVQTAPFQTNIKGPKYSEPGEDGMITFFGKKRKKDGNVDSTAAPKKPIDQGPKKSVYSINPFDVAAQKKELEKKINALPEKTKKPKKVVKKVQQPPAEREEQEAPSKPSKSQKKKKS